MENLHVAVASEMSESVTILSTTTERLLQIQVRFARSKQNPTTHLTHSMVLEYVSPRFHVVVVVVVVVVVEVVPKIDCVKVS